MTIQLRDYQEETIAAIQYAYQRGYRAPLVELFTGAGKTAVFQEYIRRFIDPQKHRALVLTPAHLVEQTYHRFIRNYPKLASGWTTVGAKTYRTTGREIADLVQPDARILFGSVPTVIDRVPTDPVGLVEKDFFVKDGGVLKRPESERNVLISSRMDEILRYGHIDLVIWDEAHHAVSPAGLLLWNRLKEIAKILDRETRLIGFTATAFREDGIALSNIFDCIPIRRNIDWGIANGYLTPLETPIRVHATLPGGTDKVMKVDNWKETIFRVWEEKAKDRLTLAYFDSVATSREFAKYCQERGVSAAHIDFEQTLFPDGTFAKRDARQQIFDSFLRGQIKIICNYSVIYEGIDLPPASVLLWARPTDNSVIITQAVGRILRLFDGDDNLPKKESALIIDITSKDMSIVGAGTLAGYRVSADGAYYKDDEDEMSIEILDTPVDIRDVQKELVLADGVSYSVGRLLRKNQNDWFHDESTNTLSLSVAENEILLIVPPYYTFANRLKQGLTTLDQLDEVRYNEIADAIELFESYTLWHVHTKKSAPQRWVLSESGALELLMDYAIIYINDVSDPTTAFMNKRSSWKRSFATEKQLIQLTKLTGKKDWTGLTRGEAAQKISHIFALRPVQRSIMMNYYRPVKDVIEG